MNVFGFEPVDVGDPKAKINHLDLFGICKAPCVFAQRPEDCEAAYVKVMEDEDGDVVRGANRLHKLPACRYRNALCGNYCDVVPVCPLPPVEERCEALFL